ncbi:MAG: hypothetical protein IID13_03350 [Candidatus Marinimicrobia bacterium]|nr:hypothetical protein [Candidatus Neomarinimicrobiota bacterium]
MTLDTHLRLFTINEVAKILKRAPATVRKYVKVKKLVPDGKQIVGAREQLLCTPEAVAGYHSPGYDIFSSHYHKEYVPDYRFDHWGNDNRLKTGAQLQELFHISDDQYRRDREKKLLVADTNHDSHDATEHRHKPSTIRAYLKKIRVTPMKRLKWHQEK